MVRTACASAAFIILPFRFRDRVGEEGGTAIVVGGNGLRGLLKRSIEWLSD